MTHTPSRSCYQHGCPDPACKDADYRYMSALRLDHHRGQRRRTDATQARHHVERLIAAGWNQAQVARAAGLNHRTTSAVMAGSEMVSNRTAAAILAVPLGPPPADQRDVDATGTIRRLRALVAIGWSYARLTQRIGLRETALGLIANGRYTHVRATTAATVAYEYRRLSRTPGPSIRARNHASRNGWHGPTAWDDTTIDQPAAQPDMDLPEREMTVGELAELRREEIEHLAGFNIATEEIAKRLGVAAGTVRHILRERRKAAS